MTTSSKLRSFAAAVRNLPAMRHELTVLTRDHRALVEQVRNAEALVAELAQRTRHAEDGVRGVEESVERLHRTLVEADPRLALDIATSMRDDLRKLLVEVTEQANLVRDHAMALPRSDAG